MYTILLVMSHHVHGSQHAYVRDALDCFVLMLPASSWLRDAVLPCITLHMFMPEHAIQV